MYLSKRSNGVYYVWLIDEMGHKRKVSTKHKLKSQALKFLLDFKANEQERKQRQHRLYLSQFASDIHTHSLGTHAPKTTAAFDVALNQLLLVLGDLPLHRIGVREVEYFLSVKKAEASERTAQSYYSTLASAFETAKRWNCISVNPFRQVEKPKPPEVQPAHFTKVELQKMLKTIADDDFRELCICAVSIGLRLGELLSLKWTEVDFVRKVITVKNSETFTTKNRKIRVVPMNEQLWKMLAVRKESATCALVFHLNGQQLNGERVSKSFKAYVIAAGLNDRLHFHSLRHTFATWLVQKGVGIYEVQKLMGHSSVAVTQVYAHLAPSELHSAVDKISLSLN